MESFEREKSLQWVRALAEESIALFFQENVPLGSVVVLQPNISASTSVFTDPSVSSGDLGQSYFANQNNGC